MRREHRSDELDFDELENRIKRCAKLLKSRPNNLVNGTKGSGGCKVQVRDEASQPCFYIMKLFFY